MSTGGAKLEGIIMPERMPAVSVVKNALSVACRAPSVHNSQPWHWVLGEHTLRLFVDRQRLVGIADTSGRQAIMSCGAVLDHARIALEAAGWQIEINRFPDGRNTDQLATIVFRPLESVTDEQLNRADAILQRRTDRLPLRPPSNWATLLLSLQKTVESSNAMLDEISDRARPRLARASRLTELLRRDDADYRCELRCWTAPFTLYEGIPSEDLATSSEMAHVDVGREFPVTGSVDRRRSHKVDLSKILVLSTADDSRSSVFNSGEILSRVLLECTMAGMATCTLSHLIEVDDSRAIVRCLIDHHGEPQALIRVGMAPPMEQPPAPTPRLPLDEVLEVS
jgi:hypothetical protein